MKKLVLDLDETLLYSSTESFHPSCVGLLAGGSVFYTMLRPGARWFLDFACRKFDVTIWTTGRQEYVESVWRYICSLPGEDVRTGVGRAVLWGREHCRLVSPPPSDGSDPYEKPLTEITDDLTKIAIVDNTQSVFAGYPVNGILSRTWRGDIYDTELYNLAFYLEWLESQPSMQRDHRAWRLESLCLRSR